MRKYLLDMGLFCSTCFYSEDAGRKSHLNTYNYLPDYVAQNLFTENDFVLLKKLFTLKMEAEYSP
jgi:hypothetical protein